MSFYFRRYAFSEIPLDDPEVFEAWVLERWREKDELLEQYKTTGRFPASPGDSNSKPGGWIETEVKLKHITEITRIFVFPATVALLANIGARLWNFALHSKLCFDCV